MDALGIDAAAVVGHSMGSFVARHLAERAPGRVTRLVLLGSAPTAGNAGVRELLQAVEALSDPVSPGFVRDFQLSTVAKPVPAEFMDQMIANSQGMPSRVWKAALASLVAFRPSGLPRVSDPRRGGDADGVLSEIW